MLKPRRNLFALIAILFILLFVPLFWQLNSHKNNQKSIIENRKLQNFPRILVHKSKISNSKESKSLSKIDIKRTIKQIYYRNYQQDFEKAASDRFPIRQILISISKSWDRFIIDLVYLPLLDEYIPADMTSDIYVNRNAGFLITAPFEFNRSIMNSIDIRLDNYAYLVRRYPDINFNVYYIEKLEASPLFSLNKYFPEADAGRSLEYFLLKKPKNLNIGMFSLTNLEEYSTDFYHTDHHWNHIGYTKAYLQIHDLLKVTYPEISAALHTSEYLSTGNLLYLGSHARSTLYPISPDPFIVPKYHFLPYDYYVDGVHSNLYPKIIKYDGKYTEYYSKFFGINPAIREYDVKNDSKRCLLLIGSSHAEPIAPVISQHFSKTFFVDLRYYTNFSFKKFVRSHPITDVLVIGGPNEAYRDVDEWLITTNKGD